MSRDVNYEEILMRMQTSLRYSTDEKTAKKVANIIFVKIKEINPRLPLDNIKGFEPENVSVPTKKSDKNLKTAFNV